MPTSFQVRASLVEVPFLSTSTNDRYGFRVERLPPPSPLSLSPTPLLRHGVGPLPLRLRQQTLFASPFPLPHRHIRFTSVSMCSNSNAPRNLRLLFRLVRTGICTSSSGRRIAASRHHPPTRKRTDERTEISPWHSLLFVCDADPTPSPDGRCAAGLLHYGNVGDRFTHSELPTA